MWIDCAEAGMPEVEDQKRVCGGARDSIVGQRADLKARVSGPCSWTMQAVVTASERVEARERRVV